MSLASVDVSVMVSGQRRVHDAVVWRTVSWAPTDDGRWKVGDFREHGRDWPGALRLAREWLAEAVGEVEQQRRRIEVVPVMAAMLEEAESSAAAAHRAWVEAEPA